MLWKSCSEYDYEQLFHDMYCENIAPLAVASDNCCPWILVKWVMWSQNMLSEPCLEFNFSSMLCENIPTYYENFLALIIDKDSPLRTSYTNTAQIIFLKKTLVAYHWRYYSVILLQFGCSVKGHANQKLWCQPLSLS